MSAQQPEVMTPMATPAWRQRRLASLAALGLALALLAQVASAPRTWAQSQVVSLPQNLTLAQSIDLALHYNRVIQSALLSRVTQRYDLVVAEDKFVPDAVITPFAQFDTSKIDNTRFSSSVAGVSTGVSLTVPTGGQVAFVWTNSAQRPLQGSQDDAPAWASSLSLSLTQPLLRGAGVAVNTASVKTARQIEDINIINFEATLISVITQVIQTYRAFLLAQQQLDISERSLQRAQELLATNKLLIQAGRMARLDIVQTESDIASRELDVAAAQNSVERARLSLLEVLDIDSRTEVEPADEALRIEPTTPAFAPSLELAWRYRPDYRQFLLQLEITKRDLLLAKNNRLWDLSLRVTAAMDSTGNRFGRVANEVFDVERLRYGVGLDLSIPFGDLSRKQGVLNARIGLEQAELALKELQQNIELQVRDAVREVSFSLRQVELAQRARELAEQKLDTERDKLKIGLSSNFQVVSFEDDLVGAQSAELNAKIAYLNAQTALDQTLGTTLETWQVTLAEETR